MSEKIATRHAYGQAFAAIGNNTRIIALDADVSTCTMSCDFGEKFSDRFFNVGIAEANMIGIAAGLSTAGYIPFVHGFSMFVAGRGYEQIRNSIAYPNLNVKIIGSHAGVTVGEDGATHQCLEDIGLMRVIPNMTVICPADGRETKQAVKAIAEHQGPVYLRLSRLPTEVVTNHSDYEFNLGKASQLRYGTDATIVATGVLVAEALRAAQILEAENYSVGVINMHTIKPIDEDAILAAAQQTGLIVTAEEHNVMCGLGSAVAEVLSEKCPTRILRIGIQDTFGRSGNAIELLKYYGLTGDAIAQKVRESLELK